MIGAPPLTDTAVVALLAMLVGLVVGLAYFRALRLTADLFAQGRRWTLPLWLTLIRFAGLIAVLFLTVQMGAAALIALFLGFLLGRTIAVRSASETG
jgi:N-ATPase, AtpR subunit